MILLPLSVALSAAPPVQVVASNTSLEVEMPSMEVRATPHGGTPWRRVVDGMAAEMAMAAYGIDPVDASVVRVERESGRTRLSWTELDDGDVRLSLNSRDSGDVCTSKVSGISGGGGEVVPYAPTAGREADVHADLGFLVVDDHPTVGALVAMSPGDTVTVTTLKKDGALLREWVSVARAGGSVVIDRGERGERICWRAAAGR